MGGIHTDINSATPIGGLYAAGECACVSINGANRLGSNSLGELLVFGARAGRFAVEYIKTSRPQVREELVKAQANDAESRIKTLYKRQPGKVRVADLRRKMNMSMEEGCGIYRDLVSMQDTCRVVAEAREQFRDIALEDKSQVFNTDLFQVLELGAMIEVAQSVAVLGDRAAGIPWRPPASRLPATR
ncbi:MAG: FAD-binding protein, partial [Rhodospirillales bacterium]|nr:FAD-binding protein [Rhodospirillales bacterium]